MNQKKVDYRVRIDFPLEMFGGKTNYLAGLRPSFVEWNPDEVESKLQAIQEVFPYAKIYISISRKEVQYSSDSFHHHMLT